MLTSRIAMAVVAASLVMVPAGRAAADAGDVAAGVLLGVIGSAAVNSANKNKTTKKVYVQPSTSSAQRADNKQVQTSLNYFGFPAGTPDGVMGRNSRTAVSQYQAFMGYPITGELAPYEKDFLNASYYRANAGGQATLQMASTNPMGIKGLLKVYQQEAAAAATAPAGTMVMQPNATVVQPGTTMVVVPQTPVPATPAPTMAATPEAAPALPNFMGQQQTASASLASYCNKVSLMTNTNGGFVTEAAMTDAGFALGEQFCLARTYAIAQGEELSSKVQGFSQAQIAAQCEGFGPAMKTQIDALSLRPETDVLKEASAFALQSGMSPAQLAGTAKICLSVGYRTDNMEVALASALLLSALGEPIYAELLGHHLSQGFGASKRPDLALAWYQTSVDAITRGAQPVFAPGQPERTEMIRKAAYQVSGMPDPTAASGAPQPVALPTFKIDN